MHDTDDGDSPVRAVHIAVVFEFPFPYIYLLECSVNVKRADFHIPIRISGLADGEHEFDVLADPAKIGLPEEFGEEITVHAHMDKTHSQLILHVELRSVAVFPCDRCLEALRIPFENHFALLYARDLASARELDEDDVRIIDANEPVIDISDDVRDFALLAIPMRRVHGEDADGQSACPVDVPAELLESSATEGDPRWEALKHLNQDLEETQPETQP